jgi:hypothetical protein
MAQHDKRGRGRRRNDRRFRPALDGAGQGCDLLDERVLPSAGALAAHVAHVAQIAHHAAPHAKPAHPPKRLTPRAEINLQYNLFQAAFNRQLANYVETLNQSSTGTITVSATVTSPYAAGSPIIEVDDASVFGPPGTFVTPVVATATIGSAPPIGQFSLTGSSGNFLTINVATSSAVPLPVGAVLTATVPTSAASSAATIFPNYIINSTIQLAIKLVKYFNGLPVLLPKENAPPHTPTQRGAIQKFLYQSIASTQPNSLQSLLLGITLPATPGGDLNIYVAAADSAIELSQLQVFNGIQQIYSRNLLISATPPANRLGESFNTGTSGSSSGTTSTSSNGSSSTAA